MRTRRNIGLRRLLAQLQRLDIRNDGPTILWVRVGNMSNRKLIELALQALPAIIDAIERDEAVIEFVGR